MTRLYVENLPTEVTGEELRTLFSYTGFLVTSARVTCDRQGGRSRGFGFVEFRSHEDAERAIRELDGLSLEGRPLQVR
jgi:RNA recognition motif-containing protein